MAAGAVAARRDRIRRPLSPSGRPGRAAIDPAHPTGDLLRAIVRLHRVIGLRHRATAVRHHATARSHHAIGATARVIEGPVAVVAAALRAVPMTSVPAPRA